MTLAGRNLTIGYSDRVVGRGLDVALEQGEVLALLGPNGGGKTTLLKTLLGILKPLAGEAQIDGRSLAAYLDPRARAPRRLCAAGPHADFRLHRRDRGADGPHRAWRPVQPAVGATTARSPSRALDEFGIAHLKERPYTMISGGERQLVLLARALAQEPQFIVLDEPTASLDFGNQGKVMREIRALAASGHGVLFTTHDPNHALRAADRAYLLRDGERVAEGAVSDVLTREQLEALYGAPVERLIDASDRGERIPAGLDRRSDSGCKLTAGSPTPHIVPRGSQRQDSKGHHAQGKRRDHKIADDGRCRSSQRWALPRRDKPGMAAKHDPPHHPVRARRRQRHCRPHSRAADAGKARPVGRGRKPARRRRHYRQRSRRARRQGWLHARHHDRGPDHRGGAAQVDALRSR